MSQNIISVVASLQMTPEFLFKYGPKSVRTPAEVVRDIKGYMNELIRIARTEDTSSPEITNRSKNLLASIASVGEDEFSNSDIMGNAFIFSIAGHETTASTMQYALVMLALYPDQQQWFLKKLDEQLGDQEPSEWSYEDACKKLIAPLFLMVSPSPSYNQ